MLEINSELVFRVLQFARSIKFVAIVYADLSARLGLVCRELSTLDTSDICWCRFLGAVHAVV
jgi:hypothetical protein